MRYSLMIFLLGLWVSTWAQNNMQQKIRTYKVAFLTEKLQLTPEESEQFWPVYNEMDQKLKIIRTKYMEPASTKTLTEEQAQANLNAMLSMERQLIKTRESYYNRMASIISYRRVITLVAAERAFQEELLKELRKRQQTKG